jgi:hypothetical protein
MDALYAFTDCEIAVSPNFYITVRKTCFIGVSEFSGYYRQYNQVTDTELQIRLDELAEIHYGSLKSLY